MTFDFFNENPKRKRASETILYDFIEDTEKFDLGDAYSWFAPPGKYAQLAWGLTEAQARALFDEGATFDQQYAVVAELEAQGK